MRVRRNILSVVQLASACVALLGFAPSASHAHEIRVSSYEMSETGGVVLLESDAPIGEPWMRVESKYVRVWFPDLVDVARFDHQRDASEPIQSLVLRPGAQDSAVVRIEVGTNRKLTRDNIQIVRDGQTARIRVSFPAPERVPGAKPVAEAPPAPAAKPAALVTASASPVLQPSAAKPLFDHGNAQPAAAKPAPATAATATKPVAAKTTSLGFAGASNQNLGLLLMISAVLLGIYACIKRFAKPRSIRTQDIEVLSARRLGKGSELLLVRALGSDHLLVTSSGRTERVASVPSPVEPPLLAPSLTSPPSGAAASAPPPLEESQAEGLGIITKLSSRSRLRKLLDAVDKETSESEPAPASLSLPAPPPGRDSRRPNAFGPELLSAIHQHKLTGLSSLPSIANKQSEAVAGIARLRAGGTRAN